jgi:hypothetical protein
MTRVDCNLAVVRSHGLQLSELGAGNPAANGKPRPRPRLVEKNIPSVGAVLWFSFQSDATASNGLNGVLFFLRSGTASVLRTTGGSYH